MGGPKVTFRWGRSDANEPKDPKDDARFSPDGRLPDGDKGAQHIRDIFYRMGFDDRGIVALSGTVKMFLDFGYKLILDSISCV